MPETATATPRRFVYNGMDLPDLNPEGKPIEVRDMWAGTYPELANAKIKGPTLEGGVEIYAFERNIGSKA